MDCIAPRPAIHTLRKQGFIEAKMFECFYLLFFGREPFSVRQVTDVIDDVIERQKPPPYLVLGRGAGGGSKCRGCGKTAPRKSDRPEWGVRPRGRISGPSLIRPKAQSL